MEEKRGMRGEDQPRWWGMAGVFPGELGLWKGRQWRNQRVFVAERGFHGANASAGDLEDEDRREELGGITGAEGWAWFITYELDLEADPESERKRLAEAVDRHLALAGSLSLPVAHFVVRGERHRFEQAYPLDRQLAELARRLRPVVQSLGQAGIVPVIENHGDYYVSDLVQLAEEVPGLRLLLDTGNCALIGERLDMIPPAAYPLMAATHFKDHRLRPDRGKLSFHLTGATLGEGDVGLEAFYSRLLHYHPDPGGVRMMVEWVPDPRKAVGQCLNDSLRFLERLSDGAFCPRLLEEDE